MAGQAAQRPNPPLSPRQILAPSAPPTRPAANPLPQFDVESDDDALPKKRRRGKGAPSRIKKGAARTLLFRLPSVSLFLIEVFSDPRKFFPDETKAT